MPVTDTLNVPLTALPEARAAAKPDASALADKAVTLDHTAFV